MKFFLDEIIPVTDLKSKMPNISNSIERTLMKNDSENTLFSLAADFINYTDRSVFLTGKAGTGKTTFLKYIRKNTPKQTAVVAPTGVAAINAGGVTIHSFFQLPFTPFVPASTLFRSGMAMDKHYLLGRLKVTSERQRILQKLELLIVDEISMVRCDVLDAIDTVLRHFRNRWQEPFGGVQMLLIGDMFQLPPVITNEERNILDQFYNSPYFFDSKIFQQHQFIHIELEKIYRQSEPHFIGLLNKVRNNEMDKEGFTLLHQRLDTSFKHTADDGYVILTTHNYKADAVNGVELAKLKGKSKTYQCEVKGEFYEKAYPADELLQLKEGAQVMFIKNDAEKIRRYYNGKIGIVTKLEEDTIYVRCKDETNEIEVEKERWENLRYALNKGSQQVEEEVVGSFSQFPLRLAWAITIHKSQGLTFDKVIIDAEAAFAPGQVYVALSRCTSFKGIILKTSVSNGALMSDPHIVGFSKQKHLYDHLVEALQHAKRAYISAVLKHIFDFETISLQLFRLKKVVSEHIASFNSEAQQFLDELEAKINGAKETSIKFHPHLKLLLRKSAESGQNGELQKRIKDAANYFSNELESTLKLLLASPVITDSKQAAFAYNNEIKELHSLLALRQHEINYCKEGFNVDRYYAQRNSFSLPACTVNAYAGAQNYSRKESPHPVLQKKLRHLRNSICERENLPVYLVASSKTIDEMVEYLPVAMEDLKKISGFGKSKIERFGKQFLEIITDYCKEKNIETLITRKSPKKQRKEKKEPKVDTKQETYELFKAGKSVNQIAAERKLNIETVQGHLAYFVAKGLISVNEIISKEKLILIEPVAKTFEGGSITSLKNKLGEDISFGEIRLTLAWLELQKNETESS